MVCRFKNNLFICYGVLSRNESLMYQNIDDRRSQLLIYGTVAERVSENDGEKFVLKIRDHTIQNNLKLRFTQRDMGMMAIYYC